MRCIFCADTGCVCEDHQDELWEGACACTCGGAGMPTRPATCRRKVRCRACPMALKLRSMRTAGGTEAAGSHSYIPDWEPIDPVAVIWP
jgi:hypothetical protein